MYIDIFQVFNIIFVDFSDVVTYNICFCIMNICVYFNLLFVFFKKIYMYIYGPTCTYIQRQPFPDPNQFPPRTCLAVVLLTFKGHQLEYVKMVVVFVMGADLVFPF